MPVRWQGETLAAFLRAVDVCKGLSARTCTDTTIFEAMKKDLGQPRLEEEDITKSAITNYLRRSRKAQNAAPASAEGISAAGDPEDVAGPASERPTIGPDDSTLAAATVTPMRAPKRRRTEPAPPDEATFTRNPGGAGESSAQGAARVAPPSARTAAVAANGDAPPAALGPDDAVAAEGDPGAAAPAAAAAEGDPAATAAEGDPVAAAAEGDPGAAAPEGPSAIPSARTAAVAANGDAPPAVHAPTPAEGEPAAVSTVAPVLAAIAAVTLHVAPAKVFDHGLNAVLSWVARPETFEVLLPLGA